MQNQSDWRDLLGWQTGAERKLAEEYSLTGDMPRIGLVDRILGVNETDIENRGQVVTQRRLSAELGGQAALAGVDGPRLGESRQTLQGRIVAGQEKKDQEKRQQGIQDQLTILDKTQAPGLEESRATNARLIQQGNQSFKLAQQQGNQQMQLALMQMQDNADQRVAELEYQKSRDRKEDMQYNERMEELDRKDRRAMMQNMAMGLASLGAAFAL